jgi:hypothetical protein
MATSAPVQENIPVMHLYKIFSTEFSLLSRWNVPGLDVEKQDERAWTACEQGNLDEFQETRKVMLEAWKRVVDHLQTGYDRVEEAERKCRDRAGARRRHVGAAKGSGTAERMYWESTPVCHRSSLGL